MRVLIACERPCPRGTVGMRGARGRCKCDACLDFERERKRRWSEKNRDKANAHSLAWRQRNPDNYASAISNWRAKNPEKAKEIMARSGAKWSRRRCDKRAAMRAKARASRMNRLPIWAQHQDIEAIYSLAAELTSKTGIPHEVDHIIPLNGDGVCGLHVKENLQIITRSENRSKGSSFNG